MTDDFVEPDLLDPQISLITEARDTATKPVTFRSALSGIKTGRWAAQVKAVTAAYDGAGGGDKGKKAADGPKKLLPGLLFSGTFSRRASDALLAHSGLICADLDGLGSALGSIKEQISADPHVLAAFTSPTGSGLKVVFRCDPSRPHAESYEALEHYVSQHFGLLVDVKCSDVSRICFVSHDRELFEADDAEVLPYPPPRPKQEYTPPAKPSGQDLRPGDDFNARGGHQIPDLLKKHGWTHLRGKYWCRPGKEHAVSASWDHIPNTLVVFSSAPETGLPSDKKGFDPYALYAILEHGGDYTAATRQLAQQGYGTQRQAPAQQKTDHAEPAAPASQLEARPLTSFDLPDANDSSILIGNRWLSRGDIAILASTSGMGKSSLSLQSATHWALGQSLFGGFKPNGPLKSLFFQAEDGDGDIAEVRHSLEFAMQLTPEQISDVRSRVLIVTDRIHRGLSFIAELRRQIAIHKPDLVWINPLLAFIGGDVNDSTDVGTFLREQLNSLNEPPTFAYVIVHHTAKPPKEKLQRQWNERMYEMAGSADLTNAARAIISLQARQERGEFDLWLPKRGIRAGLTVKTPGTVNSAIEFDTPADKIQIRHSKSRMVVKTQNLPVIHWERAEDEKADAPKGRSGRTPEYELKDLIKWVPIGQAHAKPAQQIHRAAEDHVEFSKTATKGILLRALKDGAIQGTERPGLGLCFYV